jgi:SAM-dependent methyltransferase
MPANQGAAPWPPAGRSAAALVVDDMLPLPDGCMDRALVAHSLETADQPGAVLEEVWRVLAPEGRAIIIAPSRRGVWARVDGTPFGHGQPFSRGQLRDLVRDASFSAVFWGEALYAPPFRRRLFVNWGPAVERVGSALGLPFAGVHIVEALKQVYRPVGARRLAQRRLIRLEPALAPTATRKSL